MEFFEILLLGIVEGFTEFLPVSSTGHLILLSELLKIGQSDFVKSFEIVIQAAAILAAVFLFWKKFFLADVWKKLIIAFIPTGILGFIFYKLIKNLLFDSSIVVWSLFLGGVFLIIFEIIFKNKQASAGQISEISNSKAFLIGLCQSLAMIPGVSRSAATILGGLGLGIKRDVIVEFSFLLAVPTMAAASAFDLFKNYQSFTVQEFNVLIAGFIFSFIFAVIGIKFLINFVKKNNFIPFGIYRILLALIFILLWL